MKKYVIFMIFISIVALTVFGCGNPAKGVKSLNVNDLRSDPAAFTGSLNVIGIMAAISQRDSQVFGIMDKSELLCTTPGCSKFYLPVRYKGQSPAMGDEILVSGSFIKSEVGWVFAAEKIKILRNHKL